MSNTIDPRSYQDREPVFATDTLSTQAALEKLTGMNVHLFGHGTISRETADSILQEGLGVDKPSINSTAYGMFTEADGLDAVDRNRKMLDHWRHKVRRHVVVLGVERLPVDKIPHIRYIQAVLQDNPVDREGPRPHGPYVVDRRFVAGYFDVEGDTFVPNPDFDPRFDPALLETTADIGIQMERVPRELAILGEVSLDGAGVKLRTAESVVPKLAGPDDPAIW